MFQRILYFSISFLRTKNGLPVTANYAKDDYNSDKFVNMKNLYRKFSSNSFKLKKKETNSAKSNSAFFYFPEDEVKSVQNNRDNL